MAHVVVTGAGGFIGRNLTVRLAEAGIPFRALPHDAPAELMRETLREAGIVVHLAGVNRPPQPTGFAEGNEGFSRALCAALAGLGKPVPLVYASSIQAARDNPYGLSKRAAEGVIEEYGRGTGARTFIFRLPNVFGKWCRPNYNSVVATFCHNISRGLPITVNDPAATLDLVYVDDVVEAFLAIIRDPVPASTDCEVVPAYRATVGEIAELLQGFRDSRKSLVVGEVGTGLKRALHATYLSYLPTDQFDYPLVAHADARGVFVEMLRTPDCGQFSYFTAHPGVTRGGHYHHSKTEKFLIIQGKARFGFRNIVTDERLELVVEGSENRIVETVPGWSHDVTNVGDDLLIAMLWANELFDRERPDTIAAKV
jgi:UDP-2-acetamido-2,6-beta-L-arabino-hexul-4-ose reductase